jgi:uncharacterized protein with HEPN domain
MTRNPRLYLEDIRESVARMKVLSEKFERSEMVVDAVVRNYALVPKQKTGQYAR